MVATVEKARQASPSYQVEQAVRRINIKNFLSFGPEGIGLNGAGLELSSLNVIIGRNGAGKSNFINALTLLRSASRGNLLRSTINVGGPRSLLWRGPSEDATTRSRASIEVELRANDSKNTNVPLRYSLALGLNGLVADEILEDVPATSQIPSEEPYLFYRNGEPYLRLYDEQTKTYNKARKVRRDAINRREAVISQRDDLERYPEVAQVAGLLRAPRFYLDWDFGRGSAVRELQFIAERLALQVDDSLRENAANLTAFLYRLFEQPNSIKPAFVECLKAFYPEAEDVEIGQLGRPVEFLQLRLREQHLAAPTPSSQLSEGTLQWMALLAVLLDPAPPPLVCLEEPEVNLHPNIMPMLANLLRQASKRTQLVVTTHSEKLVDQFTNSPESVIVCEKANGSTRMNRLDNKRLASWLEDYTLGELWAMDIIGGNV